MLKLAALLLIYAGFALFQSVASAHPLDRLLGNRFTRVGQRRGRSLARLASLTCVVAAWVVSAGTTGWAEAALSCTLMLVFVASVFVLVAPVVPRVAWGLAIASPLLAGAFVTIGATAIP